MPNTDATQVGLDPGLLSQIADDATMAVAVVSAPDWRFVHANRTCRRLAGDETVDLTGRLLSEVFPTGVAAIADLPDTAASRIARPATPIGAGETTTWWDLDYIRQPGRRGCAGSVLIVGRDVTLHVRARLDTERARATLRDSETRLRLAVEAGHVFCWDWDLATGRVTWSDGLEASLHLEPGGFGGTKDAFRALVHPDDRARIDAALHHALADGAPFDVTFRMVRGDGSIRRTASKANVLRDPSGAPTRLVGIDIDISEQETDAARRRNEASTRQALLAGGIATYEIEAGMVRAASNGFHDLRGLPATIASLEDLDRMVHPEDRDLLLAERDRLAAQGGSYETEFRVRTRDGSERWVLSRGMAAPGAGRLPSRLTGITMDITDRKQAESRLTESEALLRVALEAASMGVWESHFDTGAFTASAETKRLHGLAADAPLDQEHALAAIHPDDRAAVLAALRQAEKGDDFQVEYRAVLPDGAVRWLSSHGRCLPDDPRRLVGVVRDVTARRQREAERDKHLRAIEAERARFGMLIEHLPFGVAMLTRQGRFLLANPAFRALAPPAWPDQAGGDSPSWSAWDEEGRLVSLPEMPAPRTLRGAFVPPTDLLLRWKNGRERWVRALGIPLGEPGDDGPAALLAVLDIDQEKRALRSLQDSEARLRATYENTPLGLSLVDRDLRYLRVNSCLAAINGIPAEAHVGRPIRDIVPQLADRLEPVYRRVLETGESVENLPVAEGLPGEDGGRQFLSSYHPVRDATGAVTAVSGVVLDVTTIRQSEQRLERTRRLLQSVIDGIPDSVFVKGPDRRYVLVNTAAARVLGAAPAAIVGRTVNEVMPPEPAAVRSDHDRRVLEAGAAITVEGVLMVDGEERTFLTIRAPWRDEDGRIAGLIGIGRDITERKRAQQLLEEANARLEERVAERTQALTALTRELSDEMRRREEAQAALLQTQKLEALGQLTGGVAHDFNNVLAAISGSLELLERNTSDEKLLRFVGNGQKAVERARGLIRQLLSFARRQEVRTSVVALPHLLREMRGLIMHSLNPTITCAIEPEPTVWPVLTDPNQLEVAILNLAVNARDAMPAGGALHIQARNLPRGAAPHGLPPGDYVAITVRDTGTGMLPHVMERAAEPFFTTKGPDQGTGLGLAMVHGFAAQCGGTLRIRSSPGAGTAVDIVLPRAIADEGESDD